MAEEKTLLKWKFTTGKSVSSSPAVSDSVVYFGSWDNHLYALDTKTGEEKWKFETGGKILSSPSVSGGIVYFGSYDNHLYAVNIVLADKFEPARKKAEQKRQQEEKQRMEKEKFEGQKKIEQKEFESWEKTPITHKINLKDGTSITIETRIDLNTVSLDDLKDEQENFVSPFITYFQTDYRTGEWKGYYLHFVKWDCKNLYHAYYMDIAELADVEDGSDEYFSIVSDIDSGDLSEELFPDHDQYSIVE